jgi:hypothetical protein
MDGWMGLGDLIHPLVGWMDCHFSFIHSSSSVSQKKRQPASPETLASPVRSLACSLAGWLAGPLARSLARVFATYALALVLLSQCCIHSQSKPICASLKIASHFLHLLSAVGFLRCSSTLSCATHVCVVRLVCFVCVCGDWGAVFFVSGFGFAAGIYLYDLLLFFAIVVVVMVLVVVGT